MKTFNKTLPAFLIKELGMIMSVLGKLTIYLATFSYLEIIELNPQIQVPDAMLILGGFVVYMLSFLTYNLHDYFKERYEKNTKY